MITTDDVAGAVLTRLAAVDSGWTTLPGKVWFGRGPDAPDGYPYVVFQVEEGDAQTYSGSPYTQAWTVRCAAYCQIGEPVSVQAVQQLMHSALVSTAAQAGLLATPLRNDSERILHGRPLVGESKYEPTMRQGQDVFTAGLTAELLVQGDRSLV